MRHQTDKNYKLSKLLGVVKWAPSIFLAGALTYAFVSRFREGWNKASEKPNLETKVVREYKEVKTKANESKPFNKINYVVEEIPKKENQDINFERLYGMIARHDGVRDVAYLDTEGILTVGVGFNLEKPGAKERIKSLGLDYDDVCSKKQRLSKKQIYSLMKEDVETAIKDAKNYVGENWDELNPEAKEIIINMAYNLGYPRLSGFKKLRQALINRDYKTAADEMRDSKWYYQTGNRSRELVSIMNSIGK